MSLRCKSIAAADLAPVWSCAAQAQLGQQLLRLARQVDALEGRFASAMGHRPPGAREATAEAEERLAALEKGLSTSSAGAASAGNRHFWHPLICWHHWCFLERWPVVGTSAVAHIGGAQLPGDMPDGCAAQHGAAGAVSLLCMVSCSS